MPGRRLGWQETFPDRDRGNRAGDLGDIAEDEAREIDRVRADIEKRAGSCAAEFVSPTVRQQRISGIVALVDDDRFERARRVRLPQPARGYRQRREFGGS